jgi:glycosyltransferase involved in cell wall biosynthesis
LANVRFLDPVPKTEMPDLLAAADLGLHVLADVELFRTAVSPNKVFDYMAAGLPVLTNCPGVVTDLVREAGAGAAVCPQGLADGLARMAQAGPELTVWGHKGQAWIAAHQSRRAMAARLEQVLNGLVATPGGRGELHGASRPRTAGRRAMRRGATRD